LHFGDSHDRDRRHCGCGDELDHDLGFANVGLLDIKTRGPERAEELLDGPTPAIRRGAGGRLILKLFRRISTR
jgi:hypothetical protein